MAFDPLHRVACAATFFAAGLIAPVVARAAVSLPTYRTFGDWTVACDNVGDCEARGFTDSEDGLGLRVVRAAGRDAAPTFEIVDAPAGSGSALQLDGRPFRTPVRVEATPGEGTDGAPTRTLALHGVTAMQSLVGAARHADRIGMAGTRAIGSLSGFNAAMLYIDDAQGRVDTPGAIARPGHATGPVPAPRPLPALHAVRPRGAPLADKDARRYLRALAKRRDDCEDDLGDMAASVEPLDGTRVIAMLPCIRGAYQSSYAVFVGPRDDPARAQPLHLPYPAGADGDDALLTEAGFDPKTGRLSMFAKGRGIADCGASGEWTWDGRGFVLVSYAMLDRCGWPEPGDFMTVWRSTASGVGR